VTSVVEAYARLVDAGELRADPDQAGAATRLGELQRELEAGRATGNSGSFLGRLFGGGKRPASARGVYLWGGVGRGKSMLMDLFHECLAIPDKRRAHFHAFMLEVHARLREERKRESGDPILPVAAGFAQDLRCLAFDEMVVSNSADAMIMSRLFTALIEQRRLHVLPLNGPVDYRLERLGGARTWYVPNGGQATAAVRDIFFRLTDYPPEDSAHVPSAELDVGGGRTLHVPKCLKGVAVFSFKRLCGETRGAADYLAVARQYHTVIIVGVPRLGPDLRNETARFVTLVDALYEDKVKLIATAEAEPDILYETGAAGNEEGRFQFERTVSRLMEMQSDAYLALGHGEQ
jgi:cell division protein ZapE